MNEKKSLISFESLYLLNVTHTHSKLTYFLYVSFNAIKFSHFAVRWFSLYLNKSLLPKPSRMILIVSSCAIKSNNTPSSVESFSLEWGVGLGKKTKKKTIQNHKTGPSAKKK